MIPIAIVDLDPSASDALEQLGWLDKTQPASQMEVNEACTRLIKLALAKGLRPDAGAAPSTDGSKRKS